jgi:Tol biopolymer transport system component
MSSPSEARKSLSSGPSPQAVCDQLEKILASEIFSRSERLCAFLRFVVSETLAGRGDTLKEQVLAAELYRKRPGSDPDDDPVVRVDARRVRDKLREFYADNVREPVLILLPKGTYTPVFENNPVAMPPLPQVSESASVMQPAVRTTRAPGRSRLGVAIFVLLALVIGWWALRTPTVELRVVSLTSYSGLELEPSLSPDGNFVAFAWSGSERRGPNDIWIKAAEGEARRQLTDTPAVEGSPTWSPDGMQIAFHRAGQGIFVVSQLGGTERKIADSGTFPKWTPDGKSILVRDIKMAGGPGGIHRIDLASLGRHPITQAPSGDGDFKFEVSPDGARVAFNRYERSGVADIHVVPLAGGDPVRLTNLSATIFGLTWSPDGREIIFATVNGLRRVPARTAAPGKGTEIAGLGPFAFFQPSMSRPVPGRPARLAFESRRLNLSLRMLDLEVAGSSEALHSKPFLDGRRIDVPGRFAPDSEKLVFQSGSPGFPWRLAVARPAATDFRPIFSSEGFLEIGKWSPDGRKILYSSGTQGNSDIYVVNEDGGDPKRLTNDPAMDVSPSWSRDGRWIYYSSNRTGRHEIWKSSAEGGSAIQVTRDGGTEPIESLDGEVVFYLDRQPYGLNGIAFPSTLKAVPVEGGPEKALINVVRYGLWDVTSRGIMFLTVDKDADSIDAYNPSEEKVTRVGRLPYRLPRQQGLSRLAFSPDGRRVLANQVTLEESDLMMIDNFH